MDNMSGCKVERVEKEYGVSLDERLRTAHAHGESLRELERETGIELLRQAMEDNGVEYIEGDAERYYDVLTGGENPVAREQIRRRLGKAGMDVDEILDSVPSYQTIRSHLRECAGRDTSRHLSRERDPDDVADTVRGVHERLRRVVVKSARQMDTVPDIQFVNTSTLVRCDGCGQTVSVYDFLAGGCDCEV